MRSSSTYCVHDFLHFWLADATQAYNARWQPIGLRRIVLFVSLEEEKNELDHRRISEWFEEWTAIVSWFGYQHLQVHFGKTLVDSLRCRVFDHLSLEILLNLSLLCSQRLGMAWSCRKLELAIFQHGIVALRRSLSQLKDCELRPLTARTEDMVGFFGFFDVGKLEQRCSQRHWFKDVPKEKQMLRFLPTRWVHRSYIERVVEPLWKLTVDCQTAVLEPMALVVDGHEAFGPVIWDPSMCWERDLPHQKDIGKQQNSPYLNPH